LHLPDDSLKEMRFERIRVRMMIGEEELSKEEAEELDVLAKETREKGIKWEKLKKKIVRK
jgi:hypothetical protein